MDATEPRRIALLATKPIGELLIHEIYLSLQGESTFAGLPCVFVRLAVCDSRCVWCDTPHAFHEGRSMPLAEVVRDALQWHCPLIEVTGGEPLLQPEVLPLMRELANAGATVLLETSGAHDISDVDRRVHIIMDIKCPDSGECERNRWANLESLKPTDQIKFVIASRRDFDWACDVIARYKLSSRFELLVSAVHGKLPLAELAEWVLASGHRLRMQLQMHKFIWGANIRGV